MKTFNGSVECRTEFLLEALSCFNEQVICAQEIIKLSCDSYIKDRSYLLESKKLFGLTLRKAKTKQEILGAVEESDGSFYRGFNYVEQRLIEEGYLDPAGLLETKIYYETRYGYVDFIWYKPFIKTLKYLSRTEEDKVTLTPEQNHFVTYWRG